MLPCSLWFPAARPRVQTSTFFSVGLRSWSHTALLKVEVTWPKWLANLVPHPYIYLLCKVPSGQPKLVQVRTLREQKEAKFPSSGRIHI